eukprot:8382046-Pyramimonas_sp.AAC.1
MALHGFNCSRGSVTHNVGASMMKCASSTHAVFDQTTCDILCSGHLISGACVLRSGVAPRGWRRRMRETRGRRRRPFEHVPYTV